jgi:hypothetical protein
MIALRRRASRLVTPLRDTTQRNAPHRSAPRHVTSPRVASRRNASPLTTKGNFTHAGI